MEPEALAGEPEPQTDEGFWAVALYGMKSRVPLVNLRHKDWVLQVDCPTARSIARDILEAAAASEQDAFLFEFARVIIGTDEQGAYRLMKELRAWREQKWREHDDRQRQGQRDSRDDADRGTPGTGTAAPGTPGA